MRASAKIAALLLLAAVGLSGCSGTAVSKGDSDPTALSGGVAEDAARTPAQMDLDTYARRAQRLAKSQFAGFRNFYSSMRVFPVPPDEIEIVYVLRKRARATAAGEMDSWAPTLQTMFDTKIADEMRSQVGIEHPSVTWTYKNPDRSVVWSHTVH
jgi:hypothetical protein